MSSRACAQLRQTGFFLRINILIIVYQIFSIKSIVFLHIIYLSAMQFLLQFRMKVQKNAAGAVPAAFFCRKSVVRFRFDDIGDGKADIHVLALYMERIAGSNILVSA